MVSRVDFLSGPLEHAHDMVAAGLPRSLTSHPEMEADPHSHFLPQQALPLSLGPTRTHTRDGRAQCLKAAAPGCRGSGALWGRSTPNPSWHSQPLFPAAGEPQGQDRSKLIGASRLFFARGPLGGCFLPSSITPSLGSCSAQLFLSPVHHCHQHHPITVVTTLP